MALSFIGCVANDLVFVQLLIYTAENLFLSFLIQMSVTEAYWRV